MTIIPTNDNGAPLWSTFAITGYLQVIYLHISVKFLHELFLLLLSHINFLHVVPEVLVFEGRELFDLGQNCLETSMREKNT